MECGGEDEEAAEEEEEQEMAHSFIDVSVTELMQRCSH